MFERDGPRCRIITNQHISNVPLPTDMSRSLAKARPSGFSIKTPIIRSVGATPRKKFGQSFAQNSFTSALIRTYSGGREYSIDELSRFPRSVTRHYPPKHKSEFVLDSESRDNSLFR